MEGALFLKEDNPFIKREVLGRPLYYFPLKEAKRIFSEVYSAMNLEEGTETVEVSSPQDLFSLSQELERIFFTYPSVVGIFAEDILEALQEGPCLFVSQGEVMGGIIERGQNPQTLKRRVEIEAIRVKDNFDFVDALSLLRFRKIEELITEGALIMDPATAWIWEDVRIGAGAVVEPFVVMKGRIHVESGAVIRANSYLENSSERPMRIRKGAQIGPFSRIRLDADIGEDAKIGNFVEVKKSIIGPRVKAQHLTYIGDAEVGEESNIGAGTITCNYDGFQKNRTVIGKRVFVGSGVELVAPVELEDDSFVAAGSTITKRVPRFSLAIARARQENKEGWVIKKRKEWKRKKRS